MIPYVLLKNVLGRPLDQALQPILSLVSEGLKGLDPGLDSAPSLDHDRYAMAGRCVNTAMSFHRVTSSFTKSSMAFMIGAQVAARVG